MSDQPLPDDSFYALVGDLAGEWAEAPAAQVRRMLGEIMAESGGAVSEHLVAELARLAGRDMRTIRRWQRDILNSTEQNAPASELTDDVFADLLNIGAEAFRFDDVMVALMYLVQGNQSMLRRMLTADGYPMPSLPTMSRLLARQVSPMLRDGMKHGVKNRSKKLLHLRHSAQAPNRAWQFDAFNLDVFVRFPRGKKPIRPTLMLLIDDYSRFIVSWVLIPHQMRAADVLAVMGAGFEIRPAENKTGVLIGGYPDVITTDNEASIVAGPVIDAFNSLPTTMRLAPAYTPTVKGKVERCGQTIQAEAISGVPGRVTRSERRDGSHTYPVEAASLLSFEAFEQRLAQVIHTYNYETVHSALRGRTPFEAYSANWNGVALSDGELAALTMPVFRDNGERIVNQDGLNVFSSFFANDTLGPLIGEKVQVRSWHHRHDRVAVFKDDTFIAFVPNVAHLTEDERRQIVSSRISELAAVRTLSKTAGEAALALGAAIELGSELSPVDAVRAAADRDANTAPATGAATATVAVATPASPPATSAAEDDGTADDADASDSSAAAPAAPAPVAKNSQPSKRPPKGTSVKQPVATSPVSSKRNTTAKARRVAEQTLNDEGQP